jgi:Transglycosylase SLT domain
MQFMPATFAAYGVGGNGDGRVTITDDADSIYSAANYLVADGASSGPDGIRQALYAYNHALWYVNDVLYYAASYSGGDAAANPCITNDTATTGAPITGTGPAIDAIKAALAWIGTPYSWGGGNAQGPTAGICCSPGGHDDRHADLSRDRRVLTSAHLCVVGGEALGDLDSELGHVVRVHLERMPQPDRLLHLRHRCVRRERVASLAGEGVVA